MLYLFWLSVTVLFPRSVISNCRLSLDLIMHLRWQCIGVVGFVVSHGRSPGGDAIERKNATRTLVRWNRGIS